LINYDGKRFRPVQTQGPSETTSETIFEYSQTGTLLRATYSGGDIEYGSLIATVDSQGCLDMRYLHRNKSGELMTGTCQSVPEILDTGKIRLHETWQWTCPEVPSDKSKGTSVLEEV